MWGKAKKCRELCGKWGRLEWENGSIDYGLGRKASRLLCTASPPPSFSVYSSFTWTKFPYADISTILAISFKSLKLYLVLSFLSEDLPVDQIFLTFKKKLTKLFVPLTDLTEILRWYDLVHISSLCLDIYFARKWRLLSGTRFWALVIIFYTCK
jgi:hypothetical protein